MWLVCPGTLDATHSLGWPTVTSGLGHTSGRSVAAQGKFSGWESCNVPPTVVPAASPECNVEWNVDDWMEAYIPYHTVSYSPHCCSWNPFLGSFRGLWPKRAESVGSGGFHGRWTMDGSCAERHCATRLLAPGPKGRKLE